MYAVIKTGGKQYRVTKDATIVVEKLAGEAGEAVSFDQVLMVGEGDQVTMGEPTLSGAKVEGEIVTQQRGDKVLVFKKKRRQGYRRLNGHRQAETVVKITAIQA